MNDIFCEMKTVEVDISTSRNKVLFKHLCPFLYTLCIAAFMLKGQS